MKTISFGGLSCRLVGGADREGGGDGPLVVLLHGFGAPGDDLVQLWRVIDAPGACSSRRREDDDVFLAREVQQDAGALVQHVGIETLVAQRSDTPLPDLPRRLGFREVLIGDHGLALQVRHGQQPAITVHQVVTEIAEHHGEDDRNQDLTRSQHMLTFLQHMATYGV